MIRSFADRKTEAYSRQGKCPAAWQAFKDGALRKLDMLRVAKTLGDLAAFPGNHLEKLQGDRIGQHSIRINRQWRVCFRWTNDSPEDVEIIDYH
jgi:toxin HigB-1